MKSKKILRVMSCIMAVLMAFSVIPLNYAAAVDEFIVQFINDDGNKIAEKVYKSGEKITIADAVKAPDETNHYIFAGWKDGNNTYSSAELPAVTAPATYVASYTAQAHNPTMEAVATVADCTAKNSAKLTCQTCGHVYYGARNHDFVPTPSIVFSIEDGKYKFEGVETIACKYAYCGCSATAEENINYSQEINDAASTAKAYLDDTKTYDAEKDAYKTLKEKYDALTKMSGKYAAASVKTAIDELNGAINDFKATVNDKSAYVIYTYKYYVGTNLYATQTYHYGDKPTKPADPTKSSDSTFNYTFTGWDLVLPEKVEADKNFQAQFTSEFVNYTVKFLDTDGKTELSSKNDYHFGDAVTVPDDRAKEPTADKHYTFSGWTDGKETFKKGNFPTVSANTTYTAVLTEEDHKWVSQGVDVAVDKDGVYTVGTIEKFDCSCGKTKEEQVELSAAVNASVKAAKEIIDNEYLNKETEPYKAVKNAYDVLVAFVGKKVASADIKSACANADKAVSDIKAALEKDNTLYVEYTIAFVNEDGKTPVVEAKKYHYGDKITVPEAPVKAATDNSHFTFAGWSTGKEILPADKITTASSDMTYTAYFVEEAHKGGEATCAKRAVCSVCGAEYGEAIAHTPAEAVKENEVAGTCQTKASYDEVVYCSVCGGEISRTTKEGEMGAHVPVVDEAVPATCIAEGKTEGSHCSVCNVVITAQTVIPVDPEAHKEKVEIEAIDASCTEGGKTAKIVCELCGKVIQESVDTEALGHDYESVVITPAKYGETGSRGKQCTRCGILSDVTAIAAVKSIKLSYTNYKYDGKAHKPVVTVTDSDGEKLVKGVDYDLTYSSGRTKVGTYKVKVTFKGAYDGEKSIKFYIKPGKVGKITTKNNSDAIKLIWDKVPGATGYRVFRYDTSTKKYTKIVDTEKRYYTVRKLKPGTKYVYAVRAYNNEGDTVYWGVYLSDNVTTATKPATPKVTLKAGTKKLTVNFNKVNGASGYEIYVKAGSNGSYKKVKTLTKTSYTVKGLKSGTKYSVKVRAYKTVGKTFNSSFSTTRSVKVK